jgi:transglutaminase-like putative cysteine protease
MRFSLVHKLTSYLMVLAAVSSLWFSPEISGTAKLLSLLAIAGSWFAEPGRLPIQRLTFVWNLATLLFFVYLVVEVVHGGSVITAGVHFLLFVLVNKLYNRASSKDYRQAYVISFLILVAATTLNTDISYAASFVAYVVLATWALTLFHLRREMEENYLLRHADGAQSEKVEVQRILNSRRIVGLPFLASTSAVSAGVLVMAALIFLLFPRVGFGLFLGHRRGGVAIVGFRERVELGHHGVVRDNPQVVMRVRFPGGRPAAPLYWRGTVYDRYEQGVWSHSRDLRGRAYRILKRDRLYPIPFALGRRRPLPPEQVRRRFLRQEIYLEPLDSSVIFAADRPVALQVPTPVVGTRPFFIPRWTPVGEVRGDKMRTAGVRYVAYSSLARPPPSLLGAAQPMDSPRLDRYLQLPAGLPERVGRLARRVTRGKRSVHDKVLAVRDHLRRNYAYTLKLTHDPRLEPVDEFLFVTRRGHCEYFASAMALMLRHLGIHTRQVNGFVGGAWNDYGDYLGVRQGDAHAWVEVRFSNAGWVAFDPTPSGTLPAATGLMAGLRQFTDALRLRWFRYVVEYDLGKQVSLARGLGRLFRRSPAVPGQGWLAANRRLLLLGAGLLLLGVALWVWYSRRQRRGREGPRRRRQRLSGVSALYARLLSLLARGGHSKPDGLTPLEFALQLDRGQVPGAPLVRQFTSIYYDVRFGDTELSPDRTRELDRLLKQLQSLLGKREGDPGAADRSESEPG